MLIGSLTRTPPDGLPCKLGRAQLCSKPCRRASRNLFRVGNRCARAAGSSARNSAPTASDREACGLLLPPAMERNQHELRGASGFTLIETAIVVALMALLMSFVIPSFSRQRTRSDARSHAARIMGVLKEARAQAISFGQPVMVLFDDPVAPAVLPVRSFARIVRNTDSNCEEDSAVDVITDVEIEPGLSDSVSAYGMHPVMTEPYPAAAVPTEDQPGTTLGALNGGTSFGDDPVSGLPAVAFDDKGMPVTIQLGGTCGTAGSGAGAVYVTDNNTGVYGVILAPLGSLKMFSLNPESQQWN
jgi:prepilin-type N-terminal cleavage/methylation domain-containing protein